MTAISTKLVYSQSESSATVCFLDYFDYWAVSQPWCCCFTGLALVSILISTVLLVLSDYFNDVHFNSAKAVISTFTFQKIT